MQSSLIPGISEQIVNEIRGVLVNHPNVVRARIFGSRAKGVYRSNSDIDIAVDGNVTPLEASIIKGDLEELSCPVFFDVVSYQSISNADLREHIDRVGVVMYTSR
jgi:predicted nucleotidyltransferase